MGVLQSCSDLLQGCFNNSDTDLFFTKLTTQDCINFFLYHDYVSLFGRPCNKCDSPIMSVAACSKCYMFQQFGTSSPNIPHQQLTYKHVAIYLQVCYNLCIFLCLLALLGDFQFKVIDLIIIFCF